MQFFDDSGPTARLAVWALLVPDDSMSVDVLLGRDSWLRFATHTYTTDSPVSNRPLSGRLKLGHIDTDSGAQAYVDDPTQTGDSGAQAYVDDPTQTGDAFRLYYVGEHVVSLSQEPQQVHVNLVRRN